MEIIIGTTYRRLALIRINATVAEWWYIADTIQDLVSVDVEVIIIGLDSYEFDEPKYYSRSRKAFRVGKIQEVAPDTK